MDANALISYASQMLLLVLYLSMPPIVAAAGVGTLVALLQALTQLQEQTLSFAIKLIVVIIVIFATAQWLGAELYNYSDHVFNSISQVGS